MKPHRSSRFEHLGAFTLFELLVVIAIIAILAGMLPFLGRAAVQDWTWMTNHSAPLRN